MPDRDRYLDAAPIFLRAVELSPEERLEWVRDVCSNDEDLFKEVVSLLEYDVRRDLTPPPVNA